MYNISVVLFKAQNQDISYVLSSVKHFRFLHKIFFIDNAEGYNKSAFLKDTPKVKYIEASHNGGYGFGHNIAIRETILNEEVKAHFVINLDVRFETHIFDTMYEKYVNKTEIGIVSPRINFEDGKEQVMAKLVPSPIDLLIKRFYLHILGKDYVKFALQRYYETNSTVYAPYLSGCFMYLNRDSILKNGIFDEQFFMYPEDIDLTRRYSLDFWCQQDRSFQIVHNFEGSSRKNLKMFLVHAVNMCRYYNKYGWLFDKNRKLINNKYIQKNEDTNNI
jgi:GT2 family glycosyltransferase